MAEKNMKARIIHKHDTVSNWEKATGFIPKQGEIIVYDIDDNCTYERIKIGDGVQNVNALPFIDDALRSDVSEQISAAIDETTADDFGVYVQDTEPTDAVAGDIWIDTANDPSYIPPTIPEITEADNGKVLMVVNGTLQLVNLDLSLDANGVLSI